MLMSSTIDSIKLKPDPPKPGQNLTVIVKGTANEEIEVSTGAGARADATQGGCVVTPQTHKH